jgi:hypothetical protein
MSGTTLKEARAAEITRVINAAAPLLASVLADGGASRATFTFGRTSIRAQITDPAHHYKYGQLMKTFAAAGWGYSTQIDGDPDRFSISLLPPWTLTQTDIRIEQP